MILIDKIKKSGAQTGFLTRSEIEKLTNGLLKKHYLANLDCAKSGINGKMMFGKLVIYPVSDVVEFIEKKFGA
ncbi:MAG: hypothetical protein LC660_10375 [Desulfobacteraceae bacterium]|nr:hypothetical protein [Desulfobacteraceae bacterium]